MTHPQPSPGAPGTAEPAPVSVVLAGGGTGGHIEPMLALADALRRRDRVDVRITCLGTARGMETRPGPPRGGGPRRAPGAGVPPGAPPAGPAAPQADAGAAPGPRPGRRLGPED